MGRRSTKSSPAPGAALPFDSVGMTILPGVSLPAWAEPAAAAAEALAQSAPELIADAPEAVAAAPEAVMAPQETVAAQPTSPAPLAADTPGTDWAALAATQQAPVEDRAGSPEPALAMAGALVGATAAAGQGGYGHAASSYPTEPSRYPAAPAAGLAAMAPAPTTSPAEHLAAGGVATGTHAGQTETRTFSEPTPASGPGQVTMPGQGTQEATGAAATPSSGRTSPERPELSPEHVALLSWWADMIAAGQFPAPAGMPGTEATPVKKPRRDFPVKAAALGLIAVVALGGAAVVGPKVMASGDPVVVPATELSLPATVGDLVAITDPAVGTQLEALLGFGLRPAGVTVTNAYGSAAEGPLAMAAMATTMGAPAEAVGQIAAWAERTGATVAPSVPGTGANEGITCAPVEAIPDGEPGSFCVWTASGKRGQTYSVAMTVEDAQTVTNQMRISVTGT